MIDATSIVTSITAFLKVNILFPLMNPEPTQGVNRELNVQGRGRHRLSLQPKQVD